MVLMLFSTKLKIQRTISKNRLLFKYWMKTKPKTREMEIHFTLMNLKNS
jgi:hypothetical protein